MPSFTVFKGSKDGSIKETTTTKDLGPNEVLIKVTHSGLCGTDIHYKHVDMGLGHEGVGEVTEIGKDVKLFKKGDRAGWGCKHFHSLSSFPPSSTQLHKHNCGPSMIEYTLTAPTPQTSTAPA